MKKIWIEKLRFTLDKKEYRAAICGCNFYNDYQYKEVVKYLSSQERDYYCSLKYSKKIKSYLLGRYTAKLAVAEYIDDNTLGNISIINGAFNQPIVEYPGKSNIQISITHCNNSGIAVAFPESFIIGIDLEEIGGNVKRTIADYITTEEASLYRNFSCDKDIFYTVLWTAKEAISKVIKTGFMVSMNIFEIDRIEKENNSYISYYKNFFHYKVKSYILNKYIFSLAYPKNAEFDMDINVLKHNLCNMLSYETRVHDE